ncbi:MAG TPA: putative Ig domain-containing protein, partial [Planctomycetota bacterium]|nr:putative Ig domain-containing protein [Planctomycetota bacterium]
MLRKSSSLFYLLALTLISLSAQVFAGTTVNLTHTVPINTNAATGWDSALVISTRPGTNLDSTSNPKYSTADKLYIDAAVINNGTSPAGPFTVRILYDTVIVADINLQGLGAGEVRKIEDVEYAGPLAYGTHSIKMIIDFFNQVVESDETVLNNQFTRNIFVEYPAPVITSASSVQGTAGSYFSYQIEASNMPTAGGGYSMGGANIPEWLQIDPSTGLIYGTPPLDPAPVNFQMTVSASNASATGSLLVSVTINPERPVIISPLYATATIGEPFTYTGEITGSQTPTTWTIRPMPQAGLSAAGNVISGIPTQAATIFVTLTAQNSAGTDIEVLQIDILGPPVIGGDMSVTATVGKPFTYQIAATQNPYFYATGSANIPPNLTLPAGLSLNSQTGLISGTPAAGTAGTYTIPLFATNKQGSGSGTLTLAIRANDARPAITGPKTMHGFTGVPFFYGITPTPLPSDATEGYTYSFSGALPPGVSPKMVSRCNPLTGEITSTFTGEFLGTPSHAKKPIGALGNWDIAVTAFYKDVNGTTQSVTEMVRFVIDGDRPHWRNANLKLGMAGQQGQTTFQGVSTTTDVTTYAPGSSIQPFAGVPASPFSLGLATFGGTGGTPGLYWNLISVDHQLNGLSTEIDPWPFIPVGIRQPDVDCGNGTIVPAPVVPYTSATFYVGEPPTAVNVGAGSGAYTATLQIDASFNRNYILSGGPNPMLPSDGLVGLPNPALGLTTTTAEVPLSTIGLNVTGAGTIVGVPAPLYAGVFYAKIQYTQPGRLCAGPLTGYGLATFHIEHNGPGQGIVISPRAAVGEFNKPFTYTFQYANGTNTPFLAGGTMPAGLSFAGQTISGTVVHTPTNPHPQYNPVTGAVGPFTLFFTHPPPNTTRLKDYNSYVGNATPGYLVAGSNGHDTATPYPIAITLVFFDKASDKPQIVSSPRVTASELVPFEYRAVASNNATLIRPVVGVNAVGTLLPLPRAFNGTSAGTFMQFSNTADSQCTISGIPSIGTAEFYPSDNNDFFAGEVMKPKTHSILFECFSANSGKYGYTVVDLKITPAIPVITPALDSGVQLGLNTVRNLGLSSVSLVADNPSLTHPFYTPTNGYGAGGHGTPGYRIGAFQYEDEDTYWNRYLIPPYNANRGFLYGATQLPGGMSLDTNSSLQFQNPGLIQGTLTTVEQTESIVSTYNSYGADSRTVTFRSRPIEVTSPLTATALVGTDFVYQITGTGNPNFFIATGLPPGLNIDTASGLITGKPLIPSDPANPTNPQEAIEIEL